MNWSSAPPERAVHCQGWVVSETSAAGEPVSSAAGAVSVGADTAAVGVEAAGVVSGCGIAPPQAASSNEARIAITSRLVFILVIPFDISFSLTLVPEAQAGCQTIIAIPSWGQSACSGCPAAASVGEPWRSSAVFVTNATVAKVVGLRDGSISRSPVYRSGRNATSSKISENGRL